MTPETFGDAALRLCAVAGRLLGWRPDDFWHATPAELAAMLTPPGQAQPGIGRTDLSRMMEHDHD